MENTATPNMNAVIRDTLRASALEAEFIGRPLTTSEYIYLQRQIYRGAYNWADIYRALNLKNNGALD
jgi:hypothetical protein